MTPWFRLRYDRPFSHDSYISTYVEFLFAIKKLAGISIIALHRFDYQSTNDYTDYINRIDFSN